MSTGNLTIVILLVVAVAGLAGWMLSLENRQDKLGGEDEDPVDRPEQGPVLPAGEEVASLRSRLERLEAVVDVQEGTLSGIGTRQERLEDELDVLHAKLEALPAPVEAGETVSIPAEDAADLKQAIEAVLDNRQEEARKQRAVSMARRFSGFLLRDAQVTPDQREQVTQALLSYMDEREKIRDRYPEEQDRAAREAAMADLDQRRNVQLVQIVGASVFSEMEERLNRIRRGGNRRGPPRANRR